MLTQKIKLFTLKGEKSIKAKLDMTEREHAHVKGWVVTLDSTDEEGIAVSLYKRYLDLEYYMITVNSQPIKLTS